MWEEESSHHFAILDVFDADDCCASDLLRGMSNKSRLDF